jgi:hypothetical protein
MKKPPTLPDKARAIGCIGWPKHFDSRTYPRTEEGPGRGSKPFTRKAGDRARGEAAAILPGPFSASTSKSIYHFTGPGLAKGSVLSLPRGSAAMLAKKLGLIRAGSTNPKCKSTYQFHRIAAATPRLGAFLARAEGIDQ